VDAGTGQSDYDLYIYEGVVGNLGGNTPADFQSATSGYRPEIATVAPLKDGTTHYTIKIVPFQPTGETVNVKIELLPGSGGCGTPGFGGADKTKANSPRYITFNAPPGSSAEVSNGEFNIGFNPFTHRIMVMNAGPVWRLTPPEILTPSKPECCEALWEDKSPSNSDILALDPILWTDQKTGRTSFRTIQRVQLSSTPTLIMTAIQVVLPLSAGRNSLSPYQTAALITKLLAQVHTRPR
jgi:hypothetical protein